MKKKQSCFPCRKTKVLVSELKIGLEWAFLLSALLVVIMPFTGINTFARGNDFNRVFAERFLFLFFRILEIGRGTIAAPKQVEEIADSVSSAGSACQKDQSRS